MKTNPAFTYKLKALWTEWVSSGVLTQAGAALEGNYSGNCYQGMYAELAEEASRHRSEQHR